MVKSWIINSVSREIAASVMYFKTAKEVWTDINERFGQSNGSKYLQIHREISSAIQGSSDIATYFTKFRSLWDELNSSYSAIMLMNPLPPISKAYSLLQQDESQRETQASIPNFSNESASFTVSSTTPKRNLNQRINFDSRKNNLVSCKYCKKPGHTVEICYRLHGFPADFKFTKGKKSVSCVQSDIPTTQSTISP
ncbi:uncharacterized protein LOC142171834 [Nicotiana tabacum]|uniref:Uncharacterized protein LOC142171834 n=1 Tax=Nicotiana tabacum TaxID=4097 RepID=A0AC58T350_TOBAC